MVNFLAKIKLRLFLKILSLFLATELLGIFVASRLLYLWQKEGFTPPQIGLWQFIIYFAIITLFILLFLRFSRARPVFRYFFFLIVFLGSIFSFGLLLSEIFDQFLFWPPVSFVDFSAFILASILIFSLIRWRKIWLHNIAVVLAISGLIGFWGLSFTPWSVVIILIIFSIYDYIAVYKTKHMVKMARTMLEQRAIFAFVLPEVTPQFVKRLEDVKIGKGFMILGGGDVAMPLLLASSLVPQGISRALIVVIFSLIGLFVNHTLFSFQKIRHPMPALPVIAFFSILGYLIGLMT